MTRRTAKDVREIKARNNMAKLPDLCYAYHPVTGETIIIKKGEDGYRPLKPEYQVDAEAGNERLGVTKLQAEAMMIGSMAGWHVPGADVDHYTQEEKFQIELRPMMHKPKPANS